MILDEVRWVVEQSHHVRIDAERIAATCDALAPGQLRLPDWKIPVVPPWRDERLVDWIALFNSINFCYWGEPKWTVLFHGQEYDGAYGMMAALTRGLEEGLPLLEASTLARMGRPQFRSLLRGNVAIPLEEQRLAIWHEVGPVLEREFRGRWHEVVRGAQGSAVRLVQALVRHFPSFDDAAVLRGRRVPFYKRAQLVAGMLYQAFGGEGWGAFWDFDRLTVYSDYKLPQVLRRAGILRYDGDLSALVDSKTPIAAGSRMEVEVRAAAVWAGELMRQRLAPRNPGLTAAHVDFYLWDAGQTKSPADLPYHRTLTTGY